MFECRRCGHVWYPRRPGRPKVCPVCKSPYWYGQRRFGFRKLHEKGAALMTQFCPVCGKEFDSYLNLARHMVQTGRPSGEHQQWLQAFLGKTFPEYAFRHDKDIATALRRYWIEYRMWP